MTPEEQRAAELKAFADRPLGAPRWLIERLAREEAKNHGFGAIKHGLNLLARGLFECAGAFVGNLVERRPAKAVDYGDAVVAQGGDRDAQAYDQPPEGGDFNIHSSSPVGVEPSGEAHPAEPREPGLGGVSPGEADGMSRATPRGGDISAIRSAHDMAVSRAVKAAQAPSWPAAVIEIFTLADELSAKAHALKLRIQVADCAVKVARIHGDPLPAASAGEVTLRPELSDRGLVLLSALRAVQLQLVLVDHVLDHLTSPVGRDNHREAHPAESRETRRGGVSSDEGGAA